MDIVQSNLWANLIPENGFDGGKVGMNRSKESNDKLSSAIKGKKKPPRTQTHKDNLRKSQLGKPKPG